MLRRGSRGFNEFSEDLLAQVSLHHSFRLVWLMNNGRMDVVGEAPADEHVYGPQGEESDYYASLRE